MDYSDTTVMIPVKNEPAAGRIALETLKKLNGCKVLVVYKGDRKILGINFRDRRMKIVEQHDSGKGLGVRHALKFVDTKILCLIDGDATYSVDDLKKVIRMVRDGADMAIGNRLKNLDRKTMPFFIELGNKVITGTANLLYGMSINDSQTGLRAIRRSALKKIILTEPGFGIESELNIKFRKAGFKIEETPIRYSERVGASKHMKLTNGMRLFLLDFKFLF
jgi:glycosyltransferase involved in cell wall biosynthesis